MHKLLQRQLQRYLSSESLSHLTDGWRDLLSAVDQAYEQADVDRQLLERSLDLTSQDLILRNKELWSDISRRKHAEALLAGQKRVLELVARGVPLSETLEMICRVVEDDSPGILCGICVVDSDGQHLRLGAAPSLPETYSRLVDGLPIGPHAGSCGTAAYEAKPVMVSDIASDPRWEAYRQAALSHGLRACWSTPILSMKGKVLGTFAIYYQQPQVATVESLPLIEVATHLAGIAIERQQAEWSVKQQAAELVRSNADLEQFAYVASHDLQEPLRMIASYTQLLARRYQDRLDADAKEFIQYAVDGVTRMQTLINDLLSYSRVGTKGKAFEPTDCNGVLQRALENLRLTIQETKAEIMNDPLPTVNGDMIQLTQVFQNLISNAIKFHGSNSPHVHIGVTQKSRDWEFAVSDNGIGIPEEHRGRIFVIFQRLHHRHEYPGTGIGLAICKKIVERHGGRIWVESEPGKGSSFFFTLPFLPLSEGGQPNGNAS